MDDDGNRTSVVTTPYGGSASTSSYSTNNLNEYTSVGGTSQSSDANGNLTDNGTYLFLYDYKNHIVQVKLKSSGSVIASYRYDALGRRVEKNVGGTVERHILSIWNEPGVVEDLSHVVSVYDDSDVWKQNFVWSDEVDGIQMLEQKDVLDFDTDGNTTEVTRSFYHRNALGSVMEITDLNQAEVVSYRYDPYGKVTITRGGTPQSSDPLGNHWTFTGRFLDEDAGLYYYRARYYDPATGRFLQRDPLGYDQGPNLLAYVKSCPVARVDPTGQKDPFPDPAPAGDEPNPETVKDAVDDYLKNNPGIPPVKRPNLAGWRPSWGESGGTITGGFFKGPKTALGDEPLGCCPDDGSWNFGGEGGSSEVPTRGWACGTPWVSEPEVFHDQDSPLGGIGGGGEPPSKGKIIKDILESLGVPTKITIWGFEIEPDIDPKKDKIKIGVKIKKDF